ncbi:methyltransferase [Marinobacter bohaiensis]|uniref:methyltransferase n=1 Tax=Marinobacter bohaiensis TaxID=2201898 RepID=UPI001D171E6B|nr:methyltransferase [Marinobacter bohaiensis]
MTPAPAPEIPPAKTDWRERWLAMDRWLAAQHAFWLPVPFATPEPGWTREQPALARWLEALDEASVAVYETDGAALTEALAPLLPALAERRALLDLPFLGGTPDPLPETQAVDMPGRKRLQSGALAGALKPLAHPVLDWCCGKGHLARTLAPHVDGPVSGFEWDAALVRDGNDLARRYHDHVTLQHQDVLADDLPWPDAHHGVALHACGDLHRRLIRGAATQCWPRLSVSPCCFHLTGEARYTPLSRLAADHSRMPELSRAMLRLAVRETVTAPARVRRQTVQQQVWRLGFDALQRHLRGVEEYLPVPSHPTRLNHEGFAAFCRWAADRRGVPLPHDVDWDRWLAEGGRRQRQVRRHELLRHLFRRPLEVWMVLDYAVFLEERGYRVRLGTFCERALTPRNLLLDAERVPAQGLR